MLELYRRRVGLMGDYMGDALKKQSDMIMDQTFTNDIAYRKCYIDGQSVDAKYIVYTYYSISKDAVDYHLQFRPGVHYPIGSYVEIPNDVDEYETWLIVGKSNEPQFVKYNILLCNWTFKWIHNNEIYECLGVMRKRNSYNSGIWHDFYTTTPENQNQFILPTNSVSQTIDYNYRFLISDNQINPIAWEISKREDTFPVGISIFTLKQDLFDPNRDNKELMVADYYRNKITPGNITEKTDAKISYSGQPLIKVGGSYKSFYIDDIDECEWYIVGLESKDYDAIVSEDKKNTIKIKMTKDYFLISKTFSLEAYLNGELLDSITVEVGSL